MVVGASLPRASPRLPCGALPTRRAAIWTACGWTGLAWPGSAQLSSAQVSGSPVQSSPVQSSPVQSRPVPVTRPMQLVSSLPWMPSLSCRSWLSLLPTPLHRPLLPSHAASLAQHSSFKHNLHRQLYCGLRHTDILKQPASCSQSSTATLFASHQASRPFTNMSSAAEPVPQQSCVARNNVACAPAYHSTVK